MINIITLMLNLMHSFLLPNRHVGFFFFFCDAGKSAVDIFKWITPTAHLHILFSNISRFLRCVNNDPWKVKGGYIHLPFYLYLKFSMQEIFCFSEDMFIRYLKS